MSMNMAYDMIISPRTEHDNKQFHDGRTYTHQLTYKLIVWGGGQRERHIIPSSIDPTWI